tara:strand:- start:21182 stop:23017 length:1836 start_codon:yes stop_codon:yes gene_type:complete
MLSYFAMIWEEEDPAAADLVTDIRSRIERDGLAPYSHFARPGLELFDFSRLPFGGNILALPNSPDGMGGAIFGSLFDRSGKSLSASDIAASDPPFSSRICRSRGDELLRDYWGSYIGFLDCGDRCVIVRDPSASLPCFHADQCGVTLVFSHLQDCRFIDRSAFTLNRDFISKLVIYDKVQTGETGLNEVRELLGGERLVVTSTRTMTELAWDPRDFAADVLLPDQKEAERRLAETSQMVVKAWASRFDRVDVSLSGGLDSAIVLACLADAQRGRDVGAIHYRLESGDLSEESHAKSAAALAGIPLETIRVRPNSVLPNVAAHPPTARPYRSFIGEAPSLAGRISPGERAALFTGQGGDHLFLERRTPLAFADHILTHGLFAGTLPALLRASRLSQRSIWEVLYVCLPALLLGRRESVMQSAFRHRQETMSGHVDAGPSVDASLPEWVRNAKGLPPAKFLQVSSLPHMVQVSDSATRPDAAAIVHPLISQPLMELCLRLPVSLLLANGESRGLARQAFSGRIPDSIRHRMTKGSASSYFMEFLEANSETLAKTLRSGVLEELGLMDRDELEKMTRRENLSAHRIGRSLLVAYAIEAWLRTWTRIIGKRDRQA